MDRYAYDAITFDVYGTLIDWEPAILERLSAWAGAAGKTVTPTELLDAFDRARAHFQTLTPALPYPRVLRSAYAYIANDFQLPLDAEAQAEFGGSVGSWQPYGDTLAALGRLKRDYVLGALTNMDDASFAKTHGLLQGAFEVIVTAERSGAYKPAMPHFVLGLTDLAARGIRPKRVLHVAQSLRADVRPANLLGLDVVWINRPERGLGHHGFGAELAVPTATFPSLASFVEEFYREA